jgi:SUMO ligase MMS21 Smc5/6 complex component
MLQGYPGDTVTKNITISSLEQQPLKIKDLRSTIDDIITYELKTATEGKEFTLEIKTKAGIKESFRGEILLKTSSQKKPELKLSIMGRVKKELKVAPQFLHFGIIDTSKEALTPESLERKVRITKVSGDDLIIERIETGSDWIMAKADTGEQGAMHTIVITLDKNNLPKGPFKEIIKIHTTHGEKAEVVEVIIEGKVL